jgi:hypothetical protein
MAALMELVKPLKLAIKGLAIGTNKRAFLMPGRSICIRNIRFHINLSFCSWKNKLVVLGLRGRLKSV